MSSMSVFWGTLHVLLSMLSLAPILCTIGKGNTPFLRLLTIIWHSSILVVWVKLVFVGEVLAQATNDKDIKQKAMGNT